MSGIVTPSGESRPSRDRGNPAASKPAEAASHAARADRPALPLADALALVTEAAARLWTPEGTEALAYLQAGD